MHKKKKQTRDRALGGLGLSHVVILLWSSIVSLNIECLRHGGSSGGWKG
jgi:hypothetical protein